ncbi:hypothetical protein HYFRA_00007773 [Hymenoscyphus fraxineus]|uniref:FAD-binding PCMH-type domain-containing protein n=1 Tax=Hymenoscyphus fraxineus TaxID=746836 RepID=A0A9N9KM45_9HELO|nr:hypothetical protein HYFRA_00007773 [Hymenoscyphus fraxineus]
MIFGYSSLFLLSSILATTLARKRATSNDSCQALSKTFRTETYMPSNSSYNAQSEENWSQVAWRKPTCIITPATTTDLQSIVRMLTEFNQKFAIRSGGHSTAQEAANIDDGVLVDMSLIKEVTYNAAKNTVVVASGNRWGDVYKILDPFNVTAVGARIMDVGVGGSILGSGLSYLTDQYGLACDNVIDFEVVLANGSLVNANSNENPELFWALKGGTNNFGIVTRFTINTFPQGYVWGGIKGYTNAQLPALLDALAIYQADPKKDPKANLMLQSAVTNDTIGTLLNIVYLDPVVAPKAFAPFYDIPTAWDTTKIQTFSQFMTGAVLPPIPRWDFHTTSFRPNKEIHEKIHKIITNPEELANLKKITAGTIVLGFQPISAAVAGHGTKRGGNALGLNPVAQTWMVADTAWWHKEDTKTATDFAANMFKKVDVATKASNLYEPYLFMNDAAREQPVIASYGAKNVARMKMVQKMYDPFCAFQKLVVGGFKLGSYFQ